MRGRESFGDCRRDLHCLAPGQRLLGEATPERLPFEELRDCERDASLCAEIVDGEQIRMRQRRQDLCFPFKARKRGGIHRESLRQDFDRDLTAEPCVARPVDVPHPTCT